MLNSSLLNYTATELLFYNVKTHFQSISAFRFSNQSRRSLDRENFGRKQDCLDVPSSCIGILGEGWLQDGLSQKELGISIIKNKSSINKMLQKLIDADLIVKRSDENDRRVSRIFLTKSGKLLEKTINQKNDAMEAVLENIHSPEEVEVAKKVLTTLYYKLLEKANIKI